jgi:CheY-like chemotaxis protein
VESTVSDLNALVVIEKCQYPILSCDEKLDIEEVNRHTCGQLGMDADELVGGNLITLGIIHPDEVPRIRQMFDCLTWGMDIAPRLRVKHKMDGYLVIQTARIPPLRRVTNTLAGLDTKYNFILDNTSDGVAILQDGLLKYFNNRMKDICEYTDELYAVSFLKLVDSYDRPELDTYLSRDFTPDDEETCCVKAFSRKRTAHWWEIHSMPHSWNGKPASLILIKDITLLRASEAEANQSKDALLRAQAVQGRLIDKLDHMIRQPVSNILEKGKNLRKAITTRNEQEQLSAMVQSGRKVLSWFNEIRDFNGSIQGTQEPNLINFKLRAAVVDVMDELQEKASAKGIKLTNLCYHDIPDWVCSDPARIRRILTILVDNAIKFSSHGAVVIEVRNEDTKRKSNRVKIEVIDNGCGISEDRIPYLFEPFQMDTRTDAPAEEGLGVGLALAQIMARWLGGEITVTSEIGRGTRFALVVPLEEVQIKSLEKLEGKEDMAGTRILIMDEDELSSHVISKQLHDWGCHVEVATDGEMALDAINRAAGAGQPFQLALLDSMMRKLSGPELANRIKSNPLTADTTLVLMTSMPRRGDCERISKLGFSAYLTRPFKNKDLYDLIHLLTKLDANDIAEVVPQNVVTRHTLAEIKTDQPRVLIVEDDIVMAEIVVRILEKIGCLCELAVNGVKCVEAIRKRRYHLVLMDINMPEMNGIEATKAIRDYEADTDVYTPIVAFTADTLPQQRDEYQDVGMNGFIGKPFKPIDLEVVVRSYITLTEDDDEEFDSLHSA